MSKQLLNILQKWVKVSGYHVNETNMETLFLSHPDIGGIVSITDTLNDFDIENTVAEIPKESLTQLKDPFIASVKNNSENTFVLAHIVNNEKVKVDTGNNKAIIVTTNEFVNKWNGVVIVIDKSNRKKYRLNKNTLVLAILLLSVLALFICQNLNAFSYAAILHFSLSLIGITISILIIIHEFGFKSNVASKVCNLNATTSCVAVLNSKTGKFYKNIGLSDLGIIYFFTQALYWITTNPSTSYKYFPIYIVSLCSLPITLYSLYLQKFIIKKWCPLCLGIVSVLWLQGSITVNYFLNNSLLQLPAQTTIAFLLNVLITSILWIVLKPLLQNAAKYKTSNIDALSFRRNYHLFMPYYASQPTYNIEIQGLQDFGIGNDKAPVNITVILSPDCPICSYTNEILNRLIKKYPTEIYINYRLLANTKQIDNPKTKAAIYLLSEFLKQKKPNAILTEWYSKTLLDQLPITYTISEKHNIELSILQVYEQWSINYGIVYTPALFINGKLFPNFYDKVDIKYFIEEIIEYEREGKVYDAKSASTTSVLVDNT
jgi:uncharacterized membrane protein